MNKELQAIKKPLHRKNGCGVFKRNGKNAVEIHFGSYGIPKSKRPTSIDGDVYYTMKYSAIVAEVWYVDGHYEVRRPEIRGSGAQSVTPQEWIVEDIFSTANQAVKYVRKFVDSYLAKYGDWKRMVFDGGPTWLAEKDDDALIQAVKDYSNWDFGGNPNGCGGHRYHNQILHEKCVTEAKRRGLNIPKGFETSGAKSKPRRKAAAKPSPIQAAKPEPKKSIWSRIAFWNR